MQPAESCSTEGFSAVIGLPNKSSDIPEKRQSACSRHSCMCGHLTSLSVIMDVKYVCKVLLNYCKSPHCES